MSMPMKQHRERAEKRWLFPSEPLAVSNKFLAVKGNTLFSDAVQVCMSRS